MVIDELDRARAQYPASTPIAADDKAEIERRAADARSGAAGISWGEIKRDLLK